MTLGGGIMMAWAWSASRFGAKAFVARHAVSCFCSASLKLKCLGRPLFWSVM